MNLGLLSPLLWRRRLVPVGWANTRIGGANTRIGGEGERKARWVFLKKHFLIGESKLAIGGGGGSGVASNGDVQGGNS